MEYKLALAIVASLMAIFGNVPYLRDVYRGKVKPHAYTWFVWSIVSCITFFGQLVKGAGVGAIPTLVAEFFTILIFIFSLKWGFKKRELVDHVFLALALFAFVPWILTNDPTLSVIIAVSIDVIAFVPTLRKAFLHSETEEKLLYSMNITRHILMLFALESYNTATTLHSVAMITMNTLMVSMLILRSKKSKKLHTFKSHK